MAKIPDLIKYNGYEYSLAERNAGAGIFQQWDPDLKKVVAWEVWILGTLFRIPKDEDFGKIAWVYRTLPEAQAKLDFFKNLNA